MIDYKVVLILAVIFHHNHGQIRSIASHGVPMAGDQGGGVNAGLLRQPGQPSMGKGGLLGYQPVQDIATMTHDPAELFRLMYQTRAEIKRDPSQVKNGIFYPRSGGTPILLSGMRSLRTSMNPMIYMPGIRGEMERLKQEAWDRWIESRFEYPDDEEKNEYFRDFGSFPGAHYSLSSSCTENITCPDYGFGTQPLGFIMDPDKVDLCPPSIDLSQGTPDYVVTWFNHDSCWKKHVKVCHYCQVGEKQFNLVQYCLFNFDQVGSAALKQCSTVKDVNLDTNIMSTNWNPSDYHIRVKNPMAGPNPNGGIPTIDAESYRPEQRQKTAERILTEDLLKVPNTHKIRHVTVSGHCSECVI